MIADVIRGLRRYKDTIRWQSFFREQGKEERRRLYASIGMEVPAAIESDEEEEEEASIQASISSFSTTNSDFDDDKEGGLRTGLRPTKVNLSAPKATKVVETFLRRLEEEVITLAMQYNPDNVHTSAIDCQIRELQAMLQTHTDTVVIPTNKTNSFRTMHTDMYVRQMKQHLSKSAEAISRSKMIERWEDASTFLESHLYLLGEKEILFAQQSLKSRAVPTPKLLIQDHKPPIDGIFPTRLIVPARNFAACFPELGYKGIKAIFDENKVPYTKTTIIQASDLKEKLESLNLTRGDCTILSLDAVNFYPSV